MRGVTCALISVLSLAACGGPALQNVPRPDPGVVAGMAAATAAAMTLVDPDAATRGKPEHPVEMRDKRPVAVKEHVPADVLDRLDRDGGSGAAAAGAEVDRRAPVTSKVRAGRALPKLPTPEQAAAHAPGE